MPPTAETLTPVRLLLEPLSVAHASSMVNVLADPSLYEFTGGEAPSLRELENRYAAQVVGALRGPLAVVVELDRHSA